MSQQEAPVSGAPAYAPPPAARRKPWFLIGLLAFIVIGGAGWTAAWFYASGRAVQEIDRWMAAEAERGRSWSCADRQFGGFPFRFELICTEPTVTFTGPAGGSAKATRAHAVAQVWNPRHIIAEFDGPGVISSPQAGEITATWSLLQVSGVGRGNDLDRLSVAADDYALTQGGTVFFGARHAEFHVRHTPGSDAATLDIAAGVKGATGVTTAAGGAAPIDGALEMTATQVPEWRAVLAPAARLQAWQAAGGRVKLLEARLSGGGGAMNATGEIGLDPERRPSGTINLTMANAPALMSALSAAGLMPAFMVNLAPALAVVGMPGTLDGAPASTFPFTFRDGRISLGMLPLGKIGPAF
ncbi:DUF2125 domain-containing protein [Ancylobacter sp. SL191]|uniref:DUF2125 domain-containing protein n=1 Tax=Ancylobacter sp. SL191 TaxID=2995166 RepID=UPI0022705A5C|nr:DUF2125 domain-containing protein [Ancylobacter sp. SL191]WAC28618.1 DUF2125 domain-containing protein [Ancylobacter sp. SL191]